MKLYTFNSSKFIRFLVICKRGKSDITKSNEQNRHVCSFIDFFGVLNI